MKTNIKHLEARLERVEQELAILKVSVNIGQDHPWYRQIVGDFANDKSYAEIIRLGRSIRRGKVKG